MLGDPDEVGPDGADGTDDIHIAQVMEDGHEAGDAALGDDLIDDIGLADAALGDGLDHVVDHDGSGPQVGDLLQSLAGQGIGVHGRGLGGFGGGGNGGLRGSCGLRRRSGLRHGGGGRGGLGRLGATGAQQQRERKDQRENAFHSYPFLSNAKASLICDIIS